jgi:acetoin utilization protein AcuB
MCVRGNNGTMKPVLIKTVMKPFPYSIQIDAPLLKARKMMLEHRIRHLPVMQGHDLKGIVTDRDLKLLLGPELGSPDPVGLTVEDAYVEHGFSADLETPLAEVLAYMARHHIGAALITSHGRLAGIFTTTDACWHFAEHLQPGITSDERPLRA